MDCGGGGGSKQQQQRQQQASSSSKQQQAAARPSEAEVVSWQFQHCRHCTSLQQNR
jgi:hypothetical protein